MADTFTPPPPPPPSVPNFDQEKEETLVYEGLPLLRPKRAEAEVVIFENVATVYMVEGGEVREVWNREWDASPTSTIQEDKGFAFGIAVVQNGSMVCFGRRESCHPFLASLVNVNEGQGKVRIHHIDLKGGSIAPGLLTHGAPGTASYGSTLGLEEIGMEPSTGDGRVLDPLVAGGEKLGMIGRGGEGVSAVRAVDGLQFNGRDMLWVSSSSHLHAPCSLVPTF